MIKTIKFWFHNSRPKALPQSILPAILALCMASRSADFSLLLGTLAVLGVLFGHLGINLFDDYFDYRKKRSEFRARLASKGIRARLAKCSYITSGSATMSQLLIACTVFCSIALLLGGVIYLYRDTTILYFALTAAFLGISYSGWPFRFSYHGLGELQIGLMFGPMLMTGVYFSACGTIDMPVLLISFPVGLLVTNIVYTHAIMDYEPDKQVGKMTLAVLLGKPIRMLTLLFLILFLPFATVFSGVITGLLSLWYLALLLVLPMAFSLFYLMVQYVHDPHGVFTPRFWMGPMENWERMQEIGIDWFMIRWYLARNLLSFFCLIIILISFIP